MERAALIYVIKNLLTNKCYVGSTRDIEERWQRHRKLLDSNQHTSKLQQAWNESEPSDWEWGILEGSIPLIHQFESEQNWIDALDSYKNGYNTSPRAGSYVSLDSRGYDYVRQKRKDEIIDMIVLISEGVPYRDISSRYGISLGFLSKLKREHAALLNELIQSDDKRKELNLQRRSDYFQRKQTRDFWKSEIPKLISQGKTYRQVVSILGCSLGTVAAVMRQHV